MSSILDLLSSSEGRELIEGASNQLGIDKKDLVSAVSSAIPLILGGMQNNASSPEGASGLLGALENPKHNSGILDNLSNILGGSSVDDNYMNDGGKILGHIFGGQEENAANAVGKSHGLNLQSSMKIMKMVAPFVMSYLGKKAFNNKVSNQDGLSGMLGGLLGDDNDHQQEIASKLQGFDNNDMSVDDISDLMKGGHKSSGILSSLGKLFS